MYPYGTPHQRHTQRVLEDLMAYAVFTAAAFIGTAKCYGSIVENYSVTGTSLLWALLATFGWVSLLLLVMSELDEIKRRRNG